METIKLAGRARVNRVEVNEIQKYRGNPLCGRRLREIGSGRRNIERDTVPTNSPLGNIQRHSGNSSNARRDQPKSRLTTGEVLTGARRNGGSIGERNDGNFAITR